MKKRYKPDTVTHTFNPKTTVSERQMDLFEFKASLIYIGVSGQTGETLSKNKQTKTPTKTKTNTGLEILLNS